MERNIIAYEKDYIDTSNGFEQYKVIYRRKKILEIIDHYRPETILEIGCGLRPLFLYAKEYSFTIVEPSEKFYKNAKELSVNHKNVTCIKEVFEEVASELDKKYDMIVCSSLLHEVMDPVKLLKAIGMVCNKDTVVHINVPNAYSLHRLLGVEVGLLTDVFAKSEGNIKFQQNTNFDMKRLRDMCEETEMNILEEGSYFIKPFSHMQMAAMMEKGIIDERVLDGLYSLSRYMPQFGSELYINCRIK